MNLEASDGIGVVSIDTDHDNALDLESIADIHQLLDEAQADPAIRALVVTAEHPKLFCTGVDITSLIDADRATVGQYFAALSSLVRRQFSYPLPAIYALNGHTVAAGFLMAASADYRILSGERSKIGVMEIDLGLAVPAGVVQMLLHTFGGRRTEQLLSFGELLMPGAALQLGLVDELVDDRDALMGRAVAVATTLAAKPPTGYRRVKQYTRGEVAALMERSDEAQNVDLVDQWFSRETQELLQAVTATER